MRLYGVSSETHILYNQAVTNKPIEFSFKVSKLGNNTNTYMGNWRIGSQLSNTQNASSTLWGGIRTDKTKLYLCNPNASAYTEYTQQYNLGDEVRIQLDGTTLKYYLNDTLITSQTFSIITNMQYFGFYINNGRDFYIKDFKLKAL